MKEGTKRLLHLYATDAEYAEIEKAVQEARNTDLGKLRYGDVTKHILLQWARKK